MCRPGAGAAGEVPGQVPGPGRTRGRAEHRRHRGVHKQGAHDRSPDACMSSGSCRCPSAASRMGRAFPEYTERRGERCLLKHRGRDDPCSGAVLKAHSPRGSQQEPARAATAEASASAPGAACDPCEPRRRADLHAELLGQVAIFTFWATWCVPAARSCHAVGVRAEACARGLSAPGFGPDTAE